MWPFSKKIQEPELEIMSQYEDVGISDKMLIKRWRQLSKKSERLPKWAEAAMSLFNENITKLKDLRQMEEAYHKMAFIFRDQGEEFFHLQKAAAICRLQALKSEKYSSVYILTNGNCTACKKLDGKVMTIKTALKNMPIPIHDGCQNKSEDEQNGICICSYEGEANDAYLNRICK